MLEEPLRVLSDLHLGHPQGRFQSVASLRPLLEGARTVLCNGDTCELAHAVWRDEAENLLGEFGVLCEELGVRPVFLTGNHDFEISERGWLELRGGAVVVTHGDMFLPEVVPWSHQFIDRKKQVWELLRRREKEEGSLEGRWETTRMVEKLLVTGTKWKPAKRGMGHYAKAFWPPERPLGILQAWGNMFGAAERFVQRYRPKARVLIFGHFHRPGMRLRRSRLLVSTGAYMREARATVVDLQDDWLTVRPVVWGNSALRLGSPREVFRLGETEAP